MLKAEGDERSGVELAGPKTILEADMTSGELPSATW
jgi:hypothetical protein